MSKYANNEARGVHVSPGVYTKETDLTYAVKSLGITSLGVAGETVKGPAFQPMLIENWGQFVDYFGGTNPAKHKGSGFLKYELPYIAKSYLQQSNRLNIVRILGLSGYNAGPAWAITAKGTEEGENMLIAILRSRGSYQKTAFVAGAGEDECNPNYEYDKINYFVPKVAQVSLIPTSNLVLGGGCDKMFTTVEGDFLANPINFGKFDITGWTGSEQNDNSTFAYSVSLNPYDKNYIINVLGISQEDGEAPLYVEELYDVALQQLINMGKITAINKEMVGYDYVYVVPTIEACTDLLENDEITLTRGDVGKRYLATQDSINPETGKRWNIHVSKEVEGVSSLVVEEAKIGSIYQVQAKVDSSGVRHYYYVEQNPSLDEITNRFVKVLAYDNYFTLIGGNVSPITCDLNDYKEQFRFASTPWIVSELKGGAKAIELNKLFRFHTITDGNTANTQIKISIENIKPDDGLFDVVIRDFNDADGSPSILERYGKCSLVPGTSNYVGFRIGTYDGTYENKSKYVTIEINENDKTYSSVPAGFLGYPVRDYSGVIPTLNNVVRVGENKVKPPYLAYNTTIDNTIKNRKQYFGLSNLTGIDADICFYKGKQAYNEDPNGLTPCFHLDSRIDSKNNIEGQIVSVDGITNYVWNTVNRNEVVSNYDIEPKIGTEDEMTGTIYEDITLRKFTLVPYGGFDGWDVYRSHRSNTDDFKFSKYKGKLNNKSGNGNNFSKINNPSLLGLQVEEQAINSDFYAYLAGVRQFANPSIVDINVLTTPGIDYVNNKLLVEEVVSMVEEERADSIYVVTTPDKPFGASDAESDMYSSTEAVYNLMDSDLNSNYTCTYFPNVKYLDTDNNVYVSIPATKDVVRNFALTDNTSYPWFAPAGYSRGNVDCVRVKKMLKVEDEDVLYEGRINPLKTFAQDGVKLWGNKNLQEADTQMNRINSRRLLLRLRKLIAVACVKLIFEPNDPTIKQSFISLVKPILDGVRSNRGISDYRIKIDDSVEAIDRHELNVALFIKITPTLEWININFVVTPQGVNFDDLD